MLPHAPVDVPTYRPNDHYSGVHHGRTQDFPLRMKRLKQSLADKPRTTFNDSLIIKTKRWRKIQEVIFPSKPFRLNTRNGVRTTLMGTSKSFRKRAKICLRARNLRGRRVGGCNAFCRSDSWSSVRFQDRTLEFPLKATKRKFVLTWSSSVADGCSC